VLDNASEDGSAAAVRARVAAGLDAELVELGERHGWSENVNMLLRRATGRYCMLLNEDSELLPGAVATLHAELEARPRAALAAAALLDPDRVRQPSAWRFPSVATALAGAFFQHRRFTVQSRGMATREVDWAQSAAVLIRRAAAEQVGWWDTDFFVYSDEVDFCKRAHDGGWSILYVPAAAAIHHEQLATGSVPERRIVEFSRNRDLYMRKHHSAAAARAVRWLTAWSYAVRALAALALPGHDARRYRRHVTATLHPERGEGLREAAAAHNAALGRDGERAPGATAAAAAAAGEAPGVRPDAIRGPSQE